MTDQHDYVLKILILGESNVGKTCLLLKYVDDKFQTNHMPTIGIDFRNKIIRTQGKNVKLTLWDTAGQERFRIVTNTLYNGAQGIVLCYSVGDRNSFTNIKTWMKQIKESAGSDVAILLVGNKSDITERQVTEEEGKALAESYNISHYECSAKSGSNVELVFEQMANTTIEKIQQNPGLYQSQNQNSNIKGLSASNNNDANQEKKKQCC
ncbi:P-loop containing nucleoside triphosphate hydrolase [Pseudocohnilembus persalinus]|uniref:p-loop containing nucleoside triphosphate hydrolase n=1 Tax=Pseudocohnilembus persalinus TaxID=266149 RepID=A0A0V0QNL2_PSEPJ|nr:P-loop containing nucleoside triphosphate hydrolase [Pseudocohnilembus persalinus]|eukprot:KRX03903.1 P-loop containing nucleoside triphosphate hydrolase [Pseudocohnilembus persalinus]